MLRWFRTKLSVMNPYLRNGLSVIGGLCLLFIVCVLVAPLPSPLFVRDYSHVITDADGHILRVFINQEEQWQFPPDASLKIPEKLETSVLLFEDRYFYYHPGINPISIVLAARDNWRQGRIVRGGSSITMQVARLMSPKKRTYIHKLKECFQALKMELFYSKKDILKAYLEHAPYGSNIVGFKAASLKYFDKYPEELSWAESALLAILPNAPGVLTPVKNRGLLKNKRDLLLKRLYRNGEMSEMEYRAAIHEFLPHTQYDFPFEATHLSRILKQQLPQQFAVKTTLDLNLQRQVQDIVHQHMSYYKSVGITNVAVLVADLETGKIRSYIGSQGFSDTVHQGQVDGVRAPRSSGSILKPFLYAAAIDEGILHPETIIQDVPTFYGSFSPSNPLKTYDGVVRMRTALVRSLNIPAVRTLNTYGLDSFYHLLKLGGVSTLFRESDAYGLPLILGGAEVTLWDVTSLYRSLGRGGVLSPLSVVETSDVGQVQGMSRRLFSPGASYQILDTLQNVNRPGIESYWKYYGGKWPLAWKTGTSYGQRDAWAVGVNPEWVIGVWVGDFGGEENKNLSGSKFAGPLLFDIFNELPKVERKKWFSMVYDDFREVLLCAETGYVSGPNCVKEYDELVPKFSKPLGVCSYHETLTVSRDTDYQVCSSCWVQGDYESVKHLVYPPNVMQYMFNSGQPLPKIPDHNPLCSESPVRRSLEIRYPKPNARLFVPKDIGNARQKITFDVAHMQPEKTVHWYLDDHYLGQTNHTHKLSTILKPGHHNLTVVDEDGMYKSVTFESVQDN